MSTIEERVEARSVTPNYAAVRFNAEAIAAGEHRRFVGGRWDTHGQRQVDFLISRGLRPEHRLLDVGCGAFRAGRLFVDYLEPEHYFGIDANRQVMQAGYDVELTDDQRSRLPVGNLRANDRFDADFKVLFDYALAQSVFSHVSLNHILLCLYRVGKVMRPGGSFYVTFFEQDEQMPIDTIFAGDTAKPFYFEKNAYWYRRSDLRWAASRTPWRFDYIGDWGHPSGQKMVEFVRLTDVQIAARENRSKSKRTGQSVPLKTDPPLMTELRGFIRRGRRWAARRLDPGR